MVTTIGISVSTLVPTLDTTSQATDVAAILMDIIGSLVALMTSSTHPATVSALQRSKVH